MLTENCNLSCDFCIRKNLFKEQNMDLDQGIKVLSTLAQRYENSIIILTGGEPFIHPYWYIFLEQALALFKKVVITTNGTFSSNIKERLYSYMQTGRLFLQFSLDGTREIHDKRRGKGIHDTIINNITNLVNYSKFINISTTVSIQTLHNIPKLAIELNSIN